MGAAPSKLVCCLDFGTGFIKAGYQLTPNDSETAEPVVPIKFDDAEDAVEQVMVLNDNDADLVIGEIAVEEYLRDHPEERDYVIRMPKLALYHEYRKDRGVMDIYRAAKIPSCDYKKKLSDYAYNQMAEAVVKPILIFVRKRIIKQLMAERRARPVTAKEMDAWMNAWMAVSETRIPVPCNSSPKANDTMVRAADAAGFRKVQLQYEAVSMAGGIATQLVDEDEAPVGSNFMVIDVGCGTIDVAVVEFVNQSDDREEGAVTFRVLGPPEGSLHGGSTITRAICRWAKHSDHVKKHGGWEKYRTLTGLTDPDLRYQLWKEAEHQKKERIGGRDRANAYKLNIVGPDDAELHQDTITFGENIMTAFCDEQVNEIVKVVRKMVDRPGTPQITDAFISGRSFSKRIVRQHFRQRLKDQLGIRSHQYLDPHTVVKGSLGKNLCKFKERNLPPNTTFYTTRDEEWSFVLHGHDKAVTTWRRVSKRGGMVAEAKMTRSPTRKAKAGRKSEAEPKMLRNRLIKIMKTAKAPSGALESAKSPPQMDPPVLRHSEVDASSDENLCVHARIYTMQSPGYEQHTALKEAGYDSDVESEDSSDSDTEAGGEQFSDTQSKNEGDSGTEKEDASEHLRSGLSQWGTKFWFYIPRARLEEKGYRPVWRDGKLVFDLYWTVQPEQKNDRIMLVVKVFTPRKDFGMCEYDVENVKNMSLAAAKRYRKKQQKDIQRKMPTWDVAWTDEKLLWHPYLSSEVADEMVTTQLPANDLGAAPLPAKATASRKRKWGQSGSGRPGTDKRKATAAHERVFARFEGDAMQQGPQKPTKVLRVERQVADLENFLDIADHSAGEDQASPTNHHEFQTWRKAPAGMISMNSGASKSSSHPSQFSNRVSEESSRTDFARPSPYSMGGPPLGAGSRAARAAATATRNDAGFRKSQTPAAEGRPAARKSAYPQLYPPRRYTPRDS